MDVRCIKPFKGQGFGLRHAPSEEQGGTDAHVSEIGKRYDRLFSNADDLSQDEMRPLDDLQGPGQDDVIIHRVTAVFELTVQIALNDGDPLGDAVKDRLFLDIKAQRLDLFFFSQQLKQAPGELFHIPMVMGAVVATYNLPGSPKLRFAPELLADIFLGKVTKWNDPRIAALNSEVSLPNQPIIVVHRSDGSGTTYIWGDYLSKVSKEWETKVGRGTSVNWPVGLGGKGNEGVAGQVKGMPGALGYVELAYAVTNKLSIAAIRNRSGKFVEPSIESTTAAAAAAAREMPSDFRVSLTDAPGDHAYPVAGFTWILVYKEQADEVRGRAMARFLNWAIHDGQKYAPSLLYAPLPPQVVKLVEAKIKQITHQGRPLLN